MIKTISLGDALALVIDYRGKTPLKLGATWSTSGYRALSAKNLEGGALKNLNSVRHVDEDLYRRWMKVEIEKGDVLLTSEGPMGEAFFWDSDEKIVLSQRLFALRANTKIITPEFLYAYVSSSNFRNELEARATGSTVRGIRQSELLKTTIYLPDLEAQHFIGQTIYAINSKIALNRRINDVLETISQALFEQCFTHSSASKNWPIVTLSDITATINRGISPKYSEQGDSLVVNQRCIRSKRLSLTNARRQSKSVPEEKVLRYGDVLINSTGVGTLGRVAQVSEVIDRVTADSHVTIVRPKSDINVHYFGIAMLQNETLFESLGKGTTGQTELSRMSVAGIKLVLPTQEVRNTFGSCIEPMRFAITSYTNEVASLMQLRDSLLSHLISCKIKI